MTRTPSSVLVLSMAPYRFSTRTRKAAVSYRKSGLAVSFTSLEGVGRTGKWDEAGRWEIDGIDVRQLRVAAVRSAPSKLNLLRNLSRSYFPGLLRLVKETLDTPSDIVHVTGVPLTLLGVIHKMRFRSFLVLDINERPASVSASGSVFGLATRLEPLLLRLGSRWADCTATVAPGHAALLERHYAFKQVLVVRNGPADWHSAFVSPPPRAPHEPLRVVTVGTIFEGRAFEMMIEAAARAIRAGVPLRLDIYGSGRKEYVDSLQRRIQAEGIAGQVNIHAPVSAADVPSTYHTGHVGLALYEPQQAGNDSLSNKIIEVVCSGRPVLAGNLPENESFINEFGVGWLTPVTIQDIVHNFVFLAGVGDFGRISEHCFEVGASRLEWDRGFSEVLKSLQCPRSMKE